MSDEVERALRYTPEAGLAAMLAEATKQLEEFDSEGMSPGEMLDMSFALGELHHAIEIAMNGRHEHNTEEATA